MSQKENIMTQIEVEVVNGSGGKSRPDLFMVRANGVSAGYLRVGEHGYTWSDSVPLAIRGSASRLAEAERWGIAAERPNAKGTAVIQER